MPWTSYKIRDRCGTVLVRNLEKIRDINYVVEKSVVPYKSYCVYYGFFIENLLDPNYLLALKTA